MSSRFPYTTLFRSCVSSCANRCFGHEGCDDPELPGARPAGVRCERARPRRKARYKWGMMDTPEPHPRHPATMAEVARAARVSRATVSRVLSGAVEVSPETRSRVLEAVDQLGYVPSIGAQQLAAGRSQSIGLLIRDSRNPGYGLLQSQAA